MLSKRVEEALNKQINIELQAFYNYLAMAAWLEEQNLTGFAQWMKQQGVEEKNVHAMKFFDFVNDRDGTVRLEAIPKPESNYQSVMHLMESAYKMEQANTASIHALYHLAVEDRDLGTASFLKWFIDEQVEEEKIMLDVIKLLKLAGDDRAALLVLNQQLGQRKEPAAGGDQAN